MKVLHLVKTLTTGGAELHLLTLSRELVRRGVDVVVATIRDDAAWGTRHLDADFLAAGCRLERLPSGIIPVLDQGKAFRNLLQRERPDLVHTHLPRADVLGAWFCERSPRVPVVASVHDIYSKAQWRGKWALPLVRSAWRRSDALIAISHEVKAWLVRSTGVRSEKIRVIHYGIDVEAFAATARDRDGNGAHRPRVIGSIGRLEPRKGHEALIRALPAIRQRVGLVELRIAGNDPWGYGQSLRELANGLGVGEAVRLEGFHAEIGKFLRGVDVFAFASHSEGFGQVVVEAMASRVPVVASRIAPITEIVVDGVSGRLASPAEPMEFAEAISDVLLSNDEAARMAEQGLKRVRECFNASRMTAETLALYDDLRRVARG
jgi:glycosyltransferase involved in cell wall biosynthesis